MTPYRWMPLTLGLLLIGCTKPAPPTTTVVQTPPAPGASQPEILPPGATATNPTPPPPGPAPAPAPSAEPIVGRWSMASQGMTVVFVMAPDGKVSFDNETTMKSLRAAAVKQIDGMPSMTPEKRQEALAQLDKSLQEQIGQFDGRWSKSGKLYAIKNVGPNGLKDPNYVKVDGDKLIPTDAKGVQKKNEPVGNRMAG